MIKYKKLYGKYHYNDAKNPCNLANTTKKHMYCILLEQKNTALYLYNFNMFFDSIDLRSIVKIINYNHDYSFEENQLYAITIGKDIIEYKIVKG